ncbi:MAG: chemotaxis response regulator protein-glutamate methylesterase [Lachnospiraceae bacterium]|nr:chemotaxis response regulator protein-glutamate methylesterase [Lachnospiraceae bacterium]
MEQPIRKKILVVDDSPLMRRVLSDIINSDKRFQVIAKAADGMEAFDLLTREEFDAVVLDINMPRMNGLELLAELRKYRIPVRIMIASTDSAEGAQVTLDALELGALDFIQKPDSTFACRGADFTESFLGILYAVSCGKLPTYDQPRIPLPTFPKKREERTATSKAAVTRNIRKVVAIASSTGGPRALQSVIPLLPKELDAPVLLVQHMPKGFTGSFAERLDSISQLTVREAKDGETLEKGVVYVAMGGRHMNVRSGLGGSLTIRYSDEPQREGVRPSANYMYESLADLPGIDVTCVVMTGMGSDGTEGIEYLKKMKKAYVVAQDQESCVVYGMPKSVATAGLADAQIPLSEIAKVIEDKAGIRVI